ncbi:MAG: phosphotransferase family protein [Promethearchaeota archaeon]
MKSKSKKKLTFSEIEQIIEDSFGDAKIGKIEELTDGWFNTAYSIELVDRGQEVVLKVSPPPEIRILTYEKEIMQTEVQVCKLLRNRTKIPVPKILGYNFNQDIINRDYMIMNKFNGVPWNKIKDKLNQQQNDSLKYEMGIHAANINSIKGDHFGYFTDSHKSYNTTWKDTFLNMVKNVLADGIELNTKLPKAREDIMNIIEEKAERLNQIRIPQLVHWDLWEGNIFIIKNDGGYTIEGITDCERALWGDPFIEYEFMYIPNNRSFLSGYEEVSGKKFNYTTDVQHRRLMYNIYLFLIMVTETKSRGYHGKKAFFILRWAKSKLKSNLAKLEKLL